MGLDSPLRLDPIGIDGALHQTVASYLPGLLLEDADECLSHHHPLLLRIGDPLKGFQEPILGIDPNQPNSPEELLDPVRLELPHQAGVDINRHQPVPNGAISQHGAGRTVHASR